MGHSTSPVRKSKYYKLTEPSIHDIDLKLIEYDNTMTKKIKNYDKYFKLKWHTLKTIVSPKYGISAKIFIACTNTINVYIINK